MNEHFLVPFKYTPEKAQFIYSLNQALEELTYKNKLSVENKLEVMNYLYVFSKEIDDLLCKFHDINTIANNGGIPVLQTIINKMGVY